MGAGITIGSDAGKEFEECQLKARFFTLTPQDFRLLETMRSDSAGGLFLLHDHMQRLRHSAHYFRFDFPEEAIRTTLQQIVNSPEAGAVKIRLLLQRNGQFELQVHPLKSKENGDKLRLQFAAKPVDRNDIFLYHKTTRRHIYEDRLKHHPGCDDVVLRNEKGEVTETTIGNLAVQIDGRKYTPPVHCGLLAGTYRQALLDKGEIAERMLYPDDLRAAGKIWRLHSVSGMQECEIF